MFLVLPDVFKMTDDINMALRKKMRGEKNGKKD